MDKVESEEVMLDVEPESEPMPKPATEPAPEPEPEPAQVESDPAAEAFAQLEGELALMRRAVQHLAAERADIVIPDYSATLTAMTKQLGALSESLVEIGGHPAMQVTPDSFSRRIEEAAETARRGDQARINDAHRDLCQAAHDMRTVTSHARTKAEQQHSLFHAAGAGVIVGILLWSFLPGAIARAVPERWHWPERLAVRLLDENSGWEAGTRLIHAEDPHAWNAVVRAARLAKANRRALDRCFKNADIARKPVQCSISIEPDAE